MKSNISPIPDEKDKEARNLYSTAQNLMRRQKPQEAINIFKQSLKIKKSAEICHDLGLAYIANNQIGAAIAALEAGLEIDHGHVKSCRKLIELLEGAGNSPKLFLYYPMAVCADPENEIYQNNFLAQLSGARALIFNPFQKKAIVHCLHSENADLAGLPSFWLRLLKKDPAFKKILPLLKKKDFAAFQKTYSGMPEDSRNLLDPYFTMGLNRLIVPDAEFERFVTFLRRFILEAGGAAIPLELIQAIARYALRTEYILHVSMEEESAVARLRAEIESGGASAHDPVKLSLMACYIPLCQLKNAKDIAASCARSESLSALAESQISGPLREAAIKSEIGTIGTIEDAISMKVRQQYEESPYPRWEIFSSAVKNENREGFLARKNPHILVAGCGTGKEAIELGAAFPRADILAVDLSRSSLAYASLQARKFKIRNVTFKQADILDLKNLPQTFDFITCSGVLHHMDDPAAGLAVLVDRLKPGGTLRMALYSRIARRHINEARKIIAARGYPATPEGIRKFRGDASRILGRKIFRNITDFYDYYTLSECRDLLFHVQEHQFDIPGLAALLKSNGLAFLEFYLPERVLKKYKRKFRHDPSAENLSFWAQFEAGNPDTFRGMYKFWCRKDSRIVRGG